MNNPTCAVTCTALVFDVQFLGRKLLGNMDEKDHRFAGGTETFWTGSTAVQGSGVATREFGRKVKGPRLKSQRHARQSTGIFTELTKRLPDRSRLRVKACGRSRKSPPVRRVQDELRLFIPGL